MNKLLVLLALLPSCTTVGSTVPILKPTPEPQEPFPIYEDVSDEELAAMAEAIESLLSALAWVFPTDKPVVWQWNEDLIEVWSARGVCWDGGDHYVIEVAPEVGLEWCLDVVLHEYAHARQFYADCSPHGDNWAKELGMLWRWVVAEYCWEGGEPWRVR